MEEYNTFYTENFMEIQKNNPDLSRLEINIEISELWQVRQQKNQIKQQITQDDEKNLNFQVFDFLLTKRLNEYKQQELGVQCPILDSNPNISAKKKVPPGTIQINYCQSEPKFIIQARYLAMEILREFDVVILKSQIHHSSQNISIIIYQEQQNVEIWSTLRDGPLENKIIIEKLSQYLPRTKQ